MILGTILIFFLIFISNSKLHFRGTVTTFTNILFIKTSAKGKGTQCTHHRKTKVLFHPRETSLCPVKGTCQGGVHRKRGIVFDAKTMDL